MIKLTLNNVTLKELMYSDFIVSNDGFVSHPMVDLCLNHGNGLCSRCKKYDTCSALGRAAALQTFYDIRATITKCKMFEKSETGGILVEEK